MQNDDGETVDLYIPRKWCELFAQVVLLLKVDRVKQQLA